MLNQKFPFEMERTCASYVVSSLLIGAFQIKQINI